ncbi:hypothetical protein DJ568_10200 [Mucilaginibacter hurinus]|uniref:DUF4271 domain-containing protein n=1 Tax=Mucilaginibacter hurinus TaxID=2201324 RepID=A0A367GMX4_9SPHI|nr:DUF4271 domain-containing protein [Mucilaginibacter hurinus]RCH54842.1 hypothetical protein DJ568_10200 [Mucilaginibacter hurinus]
MRLFAIITLIVLGYIPGYGVQDSTIPKRTVARQPVAQGLLDSVAASQAARQQAVSDSLAMVFIAKPDPSRPNQFIEQLLKDHVYQGYGFLDIKSPKKDYSAGMVRKTRDSWIIGVVILLLIYIGFLRLTIPRDINNMIQAYYNKQLFSDADNENNLLSVKAFSGLMVLLGLTFGLLVYQLAAWYHFDLQIGGFLLFSILSAGIIVLVSLKLLLLKLLGLIFNVGMLVNKYITVLCFTYFNITLLCLPVVACLSLLTAQLVPAILLAAVALTGILLIWLYLRNSLIVISNFRFSKVYLFIYLCALEICPIFILMKALSI